MLNLYYKKAYKYNTVIQNNYEYELWLIDFIGKANHHRFFAIKEPTLNYLMPLMLLVLKNNSVPGLLLTHECYNFFLGTKRVTWQQIDYLSAFKLDMFNSPQDLYAKEDFQLNLISLNSMNNCVDMRNILSNITHVPDYNYSKVLCLSTFALALLSILHPDLSGRNVSPSKIAETINIPLHLTSALNFENRVFSSDGEGLTCFIHTKDALGAVHESSWHINELLYWYVHHQQLGDVDVRGLQ